MRQGKYRFIIGFLALPVALYLTFVIWPYAQTFQIAFTDWDGFSKPNFIGLDNFKALPDDDVFMGAIKHHLIMLLVLPLVVLILALFFSFLINLGGDIKGGELRGVRFSGFYKIVFFLPQVLAVAIVGVLFSQFYQVGTSDGAVPSGVINSAIDAVGLGQVSFLTDPDIALYSVIGVMVWQAVGFYVVLFSAGMASIPKDLFEAAALDGASRWVLFRRVTLPLLWDTLQVGWIYLGIAAFDGFALVQVMTANRGFGPDNSTALLPVTIYDQSFANPHQGYAAAMGVCLFFMTITFAAIAMRVTRRETIER
ncbi:sugar ABC transporter permease [Actinocorallia lasiicapitis]